MMNTVRVDLSFEQIKEALRRLPQKEKLDLWRQLDSDLDRQAIARRFDTALKAIRKTYAHIREEEVLLDVIEATRQARAQAGHAKDRS